MKKFITKYKKEILIGTTIVGAVALGVVIGRKFGINPYKGKAVISWIETGGQGISLDEAKALLDLNTDAESMFAIFKNRDKIIPIVLDSTSIILPK
jgi:hypothetical protein